MTMILGKAETDLISLIGITIVIAGIADERLRRQ